MDHQHVYKLPTTMTTIHNSMAELNLISAYNEFVYDTKFSRYWLIVHSDESINEQCYNEFIVRQYALMKHLPAVWWAGLTDTHRERVLVYIKRKYIEHDPHVDDLITINEDIMHQAYGAVYGDFSDISLT